MGDGVRRPHLLLTRSGDGARRTRDAMERAGLDVTLLPLVQSVPVVPDEIFNPRPSVILATSTRATEQLARLSPERQIPLWVVGRASRARALALGFSKVTDGGGNQAALVQSFLGMVPPSAGPVLYVSGDLVHGDVEGVLHTAGYRVRRAVVYRMAPVCPDVGFCGELARGAFDGALFFSRQAAGLFYQILSGITYNVCAGMDIFGLSDRVLEPLDALSWRSRGVSPCPESASLVQLVRSHYHE